MYGNGPFPPFFNNIPQGGFAPLRGMGIPRGAGGLFQGTSRGGLGSLLKNGANAGGIFSKLKGSGITLSSVLSNTQKTLNVVNQAIPIIKQTGPMFNNMKTMFKLASAFKDETSTTNTSTTKTNTTSIYENTKTDNKEISNSNNNPSFFI